MFPADGVHGFGGVQVAFYAYVALTCALTAGLWLLGLPTELTVVAFVLIGGLLLIPFWPLFTDQHPEHDEATVTRLFSPPIPNRDPGQYVPERTVRSRLQFVRYLFDSGHQSIE